MNQAYHIAKILTLLTALLLLAGLRYGHAQNTSSQPYINSWQKYRIEMGTNANSVTWELWKADLENPTEERPLSDAASWVTIGTEPTAVPTHAYVEIKYLASEGFSSGQTWYLIYSEWDETDGTGNCVARRSFKIDLTDNTFFLSLGDDQTACNSLEGRVLNWDDIDGLGNSGSTTELESYVDFTVQMNKKDNFAMNTWSFTGEITFINNNYDFSRVRSVGNVLTGSSNAGEAFTIVDDASGTFTVTIDAAETTATEPVAADYSDYITLRVYVKGYVFEGETVVLDITDGKASSGTLYNKVSDDNTTLGVDRQQRQTIQPLPATSNIAILY